MQISLPKSPWVGSPSLRAFSSGESRFTIVAAMEKASWLMANLQNNNSGLFGGESRAVVGIGLLLSPRQRQWDSSVGFELYVVRTFWTT